MGTYWLTHWNLSRKCLITDPYNLAHEVHCSRLALESVNVKMIQDFERKRRLGVLETCRKEFGAYKLHVRLGGIGTGAPANRTFEYSCRRDDD